MRVYVTGLLTGLLLLITPVFAQGNSCTLLLEEVSRISDGITVGTAADQAEAMNAAGEIYTAQCEAAIDETSRESLIAYAAADGDLLEVWSALYGGITSPSDSRWQLHGTGATAFVQGTAAATGDRLVQVPRRSDPLELTLDYDGQAYPVYTVPFKDATRLLALIDKGRRTSQFYDPASGELLEWEGSWRILEPVWNRQAGTELTMRVRLDTPESFFRIGFIDGLPGSEMRGYLLEVRSESASIFRRDTPNEALADAEAVVDTAELDAAIDGEWHIVKIIVQPYRFSAYLDDVEIAVYDHDEAEVFPATMFPLLETSSASDTISLLDIEIAGYQ